MRAVAGLPVVVPAGPRQTRAAVRWAAGAGPRLLPAHPAVQGARGLAARTTSSSPAARSSCAPATTSPSSRSARWSPAPCGPPTSWPPRASRPGCSTCRSSSRSTAAPSLAAASETGGIVTVEEATVSGGLGAAVASLVSQQRPVPDADPRHRRRVRARPGTPAFLLDHFGLNVEGIVRAAREVVWRAAG